MDKKIRLKVYDKFGGRCAYCGQEIEYKDMQVDHIEPKNLGGSDDIDNLFPTCRLCNHYKRGDRLETFRNWKLGGLVDRLRNIYIFKVAEKYGMIEVKGWDKMFYFEK